MAGMKYKDKNGKWKTVSSGGTGGTPKWDDIEDKPSKFPPTDHNHSWASIEGKPDTYESTTIFTDQCTTSEHITLEHAIKCGKVCTLTGTLNPSIGSGWVTSAKNIEIMTPYLPIHRSAVMTGAISTATDSSAEIHLEYLSIGILYGYIGVAFTQPVRFQIMYLTR